MKTFTGLAVWDKLHCRARISVLATSLFFGAIIVSTAAQAQQISDKEKQQFASETMFNCPTEGIIRVAAASSVSRFQSLAGCADQIIIAEEQEYNRPADPVRIEADSDDDSSLFTPSTDGQKKSRRIMASSSKKKNSKTTKSGEATFIRTAIVSRPIDETDDLMISIFPDAQEIGEWEQAAANVPQSSLNESGEAGSNLLSLRPRTYSTRHDVLISQVALRYSIDPLLLHAVIKQESGYRERIRSHAGAVGLMQIMPGTGRMLGVQPAHLTDPATNVDAGARLLRKLHARYNGNFDLVLAAYNAGEGAVQKYGNRIPPYRETQNYVRSVKAHYVKLISENGYSGVQF